MKALILAFSLLFTGCATIGEFIEGDFDSEGEYLAALDAELAGSGLPNEIKSEIRAELENLWQQYADAVIDYDNLRESLRDAIRERLREVIAEAAI